MDYLSHLAVPVSVPMDVAVVVNMLIHASMWISVCFAGERDDETSALHAVYTASYCSAPLLERHGKACTLPQQSCTHIAQSFQSWF